MVRKLLVIVLFGLFAIAGLAKDPDTRFTEKEWKKISSGVDFTETYKDKKSDNSSHPSTGRHTNYSYDLSGFKYLFYMIVVGLVAFLIFRILSNLNTNPVIRNNSIGIDSIEEIEERMHEVDLDKLLREALEAKNFRVALRIRFLIIIKMLSLKGDILWAREKTNWEYYSEVRDPALSGQFRSIILSFERVWYGDNPVTEEHFHELSPSYENLIQRLVPVTHE